MGISPGFATANSKHSIIGRTPVGIYDILDAETNQQVFDYDTFVSVKLDAKTKVSSFPVEDGSFASYNKASAPYRARVEIAVSDIADRRHQLIVDLDREKNSVRLFNITTQDATYLNYTLEGYSVAFTRPSGWGIVTATLEFVEVREVTPAYGNARAGAGGTKSGGVVPISAEEAEAGSLKNARVTQFTGQPVTPSDGPTGAAAVAARSKTTPPTAATTTPAAGPANAPSAQAPSVH